MGLITVVLLADKTFLGDNFPTGLSSLLVFLANIMSIHTLRFLLLACKVSEFLLEEDVSPLLTSLVVFGLVELLFLIKVGLFIDRSELAGLKACLTPIEFIGLVLQEKSIEENEFMTSPFHIRSFDLLFLYFL